MNESNSPSIPTPIAGARSCLYLLIALSLAIGIADASSYSQGIVFSGDADPIWSFLLYWATVLWVDQDSRGRNNIQRSFDSTFLVFFFLPFYLPYYLIRTRGAWGVVGLIGFGVLYQLGPILSVFVYYVSQ